MADAPLDDRGLPVGLVFHESHEITPRQAAAGLASGALRVLDVREADELRLVPFPGAVWIPLSTLLDRLDDLEEALPDGRDGRVAVICHHGSRSLRAALALRQLGFAHAVSIAGGVDLWARDIDTGMRRY